MITMPPRHGKSELASRRFPAFILGVHPEWEVIAASYNSELANDFGRSVRGIVNSPEYATLFPGFGMAQDSRAADRWNTTNGGAYVAAGVGTAVTGRGAHVLLIDDPLKDRAEAESEARRKSVWDWYTSVAYTRLAPGGRIVVINTRWHEDDLSGRLLEQQDCGGDKWTLLSLPAISDDGKALWPERFPIEDLTRIRQNIQPRDWAALYQQRPAPEDGDYFKSEWLHYVSEVPPKSELTIYGASDYATKDGSGDFTVHMVIGVDKEDRMYVLDVWREQVNSSVWVDEWCNIVLKWRPREWGEEKGQIINSVGPFLETRQRERGAYVYRRQFPSSANKQARAQSIRGRMATKGLFIPSGEVWKSDLVSELMSFPNGKHDDQIDALSLVGQMLDQIRAPEEKRKQRRNGFSFMAA